MPPGLFVTGTDTGVGKTEVSVAIIAALRHSGARVGVYKPVASGVSGDPSDDAVRLWRAAGCPLTLAAVCPQSFTAPLAPSHAARLEGRSVDESLLRHGLDRWNEGSDLVVVEGAGGLLSPLGDTTLGADLAAEFALPLVIVDAARLGAIGRSLAAVEVARARGLPIAAVVLSQTRPSFGDPDDPTSDGGVARAAAYELTARLAGLSGGVAVGILGHAAGRIEPPPDWASLARGGQGGSSGH